MRLTGRAVGKLEEHEEEEGEKNGSLSYSLIKFDPSFRTGTVLQREMVGGFKGRRTWDCISK